MKLFATSESTVLLCNPGGHVNHQAVEPDDITAGTAISTSILLAYDKHSAHAC